MPPTPQISPTSRLQPSARRRRAWYLDALLSFLCYLICLALGKSVARLFGPFGGLFFVILFGGAGWYLSKSAWRGLRGEPRHRS
jgi:hypothetical protein